MIEIVQKENKVLREIAKPVPIEEITSPKLQKILQDMKDALESQEDGVAIAAPQIGVPLRIFVVSHRAFEIPEETPAKDGPSPSREGPSFAQSHEDLVFINPEIVKLSKKRQWLDEGCLSVRWLYGEVNRFTNATVSAYDEHGGKFIRGAGGLLAQIFQHEIDHLDGTLFIDKAENIQEVLPQKQQEHE